MRDGPSALPHADDVAFELVSFKLFEQPVLEAVAISLQILHRHPQRMRLPNLVALLEVVLIRTFVFAREL